MIPLRYTCFDCKRQIGYWSNSHDHNNKYHYGRPQLYIVDNSQPEPESQPQPQEESRFDKIYRQFQEEKQKRKWIK